MSSRLVSSRLIFRKFPEIEKFESRQGPNHGLYHRKLIGYGVFGSIAGVHIDQTRPLDTLCSCVRPRVRVTQAEIQYLASVGRSPFSPCRGPTQRFQTGISGNFLKLKNLKVARGQTMGSTVENSSEMSFSDQLRGFILIRLDLSTLCRPV